MSFAWRTCALVLAAHMSHTLRSLPSLRSKCLNLVKPDRAWPRLCLAKQKSGRLRVLPSFLRQKLGNSNRGARHNMRIFGPGKRGRYLNSPENDLNRLSFPQSGGSLENSRISKCSRISKEMDISEKTPFPKDPFFRTRHFWGGGGGAYYRARPPNPFLEA